MNKESPFNIFSASVKKKTSADPAPIQPEPIPSPPATHKKTQIDPEITKVLNKIYEMRDDLETQMGDLFKKTGMSRFEIESFLNNPTNYPKGKWDKIQTEKKILEDKLDSILGVDNKEKVKKAEVNTAKERKGKLLGGRKKWIPIR